MQETFINQLQILISATLEEQGFELIDLVHRTDGSRLILTILADKPQGGITLQECALTCRRLRDLLEEKNIMERDYLLEVASPGLDRPLKKQKDFARSVNKEVVFFLNDLVQGKCQWQGVINKADETAVFIQVGGGILEIPLIKINKAQLVI